MGRFKIKNVYCYICDNQYYKAVDKNEFKYSGKKDVVLMCTKCKNMITHDEFIRQLDKYIYKKDD